MSGKKISQNYKTSQLIDERSSRNWMGWLLKQGSPLHPAKPSKPRDPFIMGGPQNKDFSLL